MKETIDREKNFGHGFCAVDMEEYKANGEMNKTNRTYAVENNGYFEENENKRYVKPRKDEKKMPTRMMKRRKQRIIIWDYSKKRNETMLLLRRKRNTKTFLKLTKNLTILASLIVMIVAKLLPTNTNI
jgi:hypothetical protein